MPGFGQGKFVRVYGRQVYKKYFYDSEQATLHTSSKIYQGKLVDKYTREGKLFQESLSVVRQSKIADKVGCRLNSCACKVYVYTTP